MEPVVKAVMEKHTLTATWQTGIAAYNSAASKIPGCEPMDFDLDKYVLDQILATIGLLVRSNEAATRACVPADASDAVKQVFGGGMRDPDELIMALVWARSPGATLANGLCIQVDTAMYAR